MGTVCKEVSIPLNKTDAEPRLKRRAKRKLLNRSKRPPNEGWRLNDEKFDELNKAYRFTMEGYCYPLGFNGHRKLPFYSENNVLLDHDGSKQSIYCNPSWSLAIKREEHPRACHSKSLLDTKLVIVLPDWPKFKAVTKELKRIKKRCL